MFSTTFVAGRNRNGSYEHDPIFIEFLEACSFISDLRGICAFLFWPIVVKSGCFRFKFSGDIVQPSSHNCFSMAYHLWILGKPSCLHLPQRSATLLHTVF